ncbi:hypothetical protein B0H19DRAFT_1153110 [Mycena capillaripes]|nr:hypothetical protein B0H19DRAFT_1153110 [Mycena capillaripes]
MTPTLFIWICIYGLAVYRHPENMATKFVVLSVRQREPRPSKALKLFLYENIQVVDRSNPEPQLLGDDLEAAMEMLQRCRQHDEQAKSRGYVGAAILLVRVLKPDGESVTLLRSMPVIIRQDALAYEDMVGWKSLMKDIIDEGRSIKRQI